MKKLSIILLAVAAIFAACNKVENVAPAEQKLVHKAFTAGSPDTKTALGAGLAVNWAAGDEISVIGVTAGGTETAHTFTLTEGAGTPSAVFEGEVGEEEVTFYAVYPNVALKAGSLTAASPMFDFGASLGATQTAVKDGFDPAFAPMTAVADSDGNFAFRHGVAFFKLTVGNENVASVNLKTSNSRFQGRPQYNLDGSYINIQGAQDNITLAGPLEKGATYYIPVICKNSTLQTLTLTYKFSDGTPDKSLSTETFASLKPALGVVYDLYTPTVAITPEIEADDVLLDADATSGSISFEVINPASDGVMSAALKNASDWLTVGTVSGSTVPLTSTVNTGDRREAVVTLTYTYGDSQTATLDVTVAQKAPGTSESHVRILYNGSTEVLDGETVTTNLYFSHSSSYVTLSDSGSDGGGIANYAIPGTSLTATKSVKLDGSGHVTFTTSGTLNSSVTFYYTKRKSGTGKIQITPDGGSATVYDDATYGTVNSKTVTLAKSTQYKIERNNGELLLIAVVVNETE